MNRRFQNQLRSLHHFLFWIVLVCYALSLLELGFDFDIHQLHQSILKIIEKIRLHLIWYLGAVHNRTFYDFITFHSLKFWIFAWFTLYSINTYKLYDVIPFSTSALARTLEYNPFNLTISSVIWIISSWIKTFQVSQIFYKNIRYGSGLYLSQNISLIDCYIFY